MESRSYPDPINFQIRLTNDLIDDIKRYINNSNTDLALKINNFLMNNLEVIKKKEETLE